MVKHGRDQHSAWYSPDGEWEKRHRFKPGHAFQRHTAKAMAYRDEIRRKIRQSKIKEFERTEDANAVLRLPS